MTRCHCGSIHWSWGKTQDAWGEFSAWSWCLPALSFTHYFVLRIFFSFFSLLMFQHILFRPSHYLVKPFCIETGNLTDPPSQVKWRLCPSLNTTVPCWQWWCSWLNNCTAKGIQFSFLLYKSLISISNLWPIPFILYFPNWSNVPNSSGLIRLFLLPG